MTVVRWWQGCSQGLDAPTSSARDACHAEKWDAKFAYKLMNATHKIDCFHTNTVGMASNAHTIIATPCTLRHCGAVTEAAD